MKQALAPGLRTSRQGWGAALTSAQKAVLENVHVIVERKDPVFVLQSFIKWKTRDAKGWDSTSPPPPRLRIPPPTPTLTRSFVSRHSSAPVTPAPFLLIPRGV
ncbi:unnamed protein product [Rangifer tarandus platyrhynchus]|uniref:Uncharacterized protein n=2 Tax=Rangifer tarandus platyrhynchus TaxID=3082113 RepID=A0ABN8YUJ2_RANTA|nr:unnamed protein product [Rangifer tarandus platyrhynchus]CAI9702760.1 unnamed protein product [Rangifer tarandus platyrhynchus]